MKIGDARVSTEDQNPDLQLAALKQAGCSRLFTDKATASAGHNLTHNTHFLRMPNNGETL